MIAVQWRPGKSTAATVSRTAKRDFLFNDPQGNEFIRGCDGAGVRHFQPRIRIDWLLAVHEILRGRPRPTRTLADRLATAELSRPIRVHEAFCLNKKAQENGRTHAEPSEERSTGRPVLLRVDHFIVAGGLISYGPAAADIEHRVGDCAGRILKGAKPTDLPVQQPVKFELVVNLKIAKTLGLTVPLSILSRADEVIE